MTPTAAAAPTGDDDGRRFPGVRSFSEVDHTRFFGREVVAEELLLRVLSVRLLLQFAPSGVGKTSLLQAGLFPMLRPHGLFPLMVRLNVVTEPLTTALQRSLAAAAAAGGLPDPVIPAGGHDAVDLLAGTRLWSDDLSPLTPVLVFDQFEEVFTLRDEDFRRGLAQDLGALVGARARVDGASAGAGARVLGAVKIIISLREEFLGRLDEFSAQIPDLFHERLRLAPLSRDEARKAMVKPGAMTGAAWASPQFAFEKKCLDDLLDFIDGASRRYRVIEPLILQLVCREAESQVMRARGAGEPPCALELAALGGLEGLRKLVADYVALELQKLPDSAVRRHARELLEQGLLDPSGKRLMLEEGEIQREHHLEPATLKRLVDSQLLRCEPRNESLFYEVSHDRLAEAIFRQRKNKLPRWVLPALAGSVALATAAVAVVTVVISQREQTRTALRDSENAYGLLLGDSIVPRLNEAGAADALKVVLDRVEAAGAADAAQPALRYRHQGELLFDRGTLKQAQDKLNASLQALAQAGNGPPVAPLAIARERARLLGRLGDIEVEAGRRPRAEQQYDAAAAQWDLVLKGQPSPVELMDAAELHNARALLATRLGDLAKAESDVATATHIAAQAWSASNVGQLTGLQNLRFEQGRAMQVLADTMSIRAGIWDKEEMYAAAAGLAGASRHLRPFSVRAVQQSLTANAMLGLLSSGTNNMTVPAGLLEAAKQIDNLVQFDPDNLVLRREQAALRLLAADRIASCAENPKCARPGAAAALQKAQLEVVEATGNLRWLSSLDPERETWHMDIALALTTQARLMAASGDSAAALELQTSAVAQYRGLRGKELDFANLNFVAQLLMQRARVLADAGRADQSMAAMTEARDEIKPLPTTSPLTAMFEINLLDEQMALMKRLGRNSGVAAMAARRSELVTRLGQPWEMATTRAAAANNKSSQLIEEAAKLHGVAAVELQRQAVAGYLEAIKDDPGLARYWSNLRGAYQWIAQEQGELAAATAASAPAGATAPTPAGDAPKAAAGAADKARELQALALAAAIAAANVASILSDDAGRPKHLRDLYEARRGLAMHYRDHRNKPMALVLARDGVVQSREMMLGHRHSAQSREQLRDAYLGVGLTRFDSEVAGWEESTRVALEHGGQLKRLEPTNAKHALWLGEVHADFGDKLRTKGRAEAARAEYRLALAECRRGSRLARDDAERQRATACVDGIPAADR